MNRKTQTQRFPAALIAGLVFCSWTGLIACTDAGSDPSAVPDCPTPTTTPPPAGENAESTDLFVLETLSLGEDIGSECLVIEDLDEDGFLDMVIGRRDSLVMPGGRLQFLWGKGGGQFDTSSIEMPPSMSPSGGCIASDLDQDGKLDLLIGTREGEVALLTGDGERAFSFLLDRITYPETHTFQRIITLVHMDIDGKGLPDLLVGSHGVMFSQCQESPDPGGGQDVHVTGERLLGADIDCLIATDEGHFVPAPDNVCPQNLSEKTVGPVWSAGVADLNHDGRPDVIIANDFAENIVLMSQQEGGLKDVTDLTGVAVENHAMGFAFADVDSDGFQDMYVTDFGPDQLWLGTGCGGFEDGGFATDIAPLTDRGNGWGVHSVDIDHDGDIDFFTTNSHVVPEGGWTAATSCQELPSEGVVQSHFLLINDGKGIFTKIDIPHLEAIHEAATKAVILASGDLDRDGDVDFAMAENGKIRILWNVMPQGGHWLSVRPLNENGIPAFGARITVHQQGTFARWRDLYGGHGTDGHSALVGHFGLGSDGDPVDIDIRWPDGTMSTFKNVEPDQHLVLQRTPTP